MLKAEDKAAVTGNPENQDTAKPNAVPEEAQHFDIAVGDGETGEKAVSIDVKKGDIERGLDALLKAEGKEAGANDAKPERDDPYYAQINESLASETAKDSAKEALSRLGMKGAAGMVDVAASGNLTSKEIDKAAKAGMDLLKHGVMTGKGLRLLSHGKGKHKSGKKKK